ncbi:hypothetical protein EC988_008007, partial [Linderina pennispora]
MLAQGLVQKYCPQLESILDTLSGSEWISWQSRQARRRKYEEEKRARERSKMASRQQQQQQQQQQQRQRYSQPGSAASAWDQARDGDYYFDPDEDTMADQPAPMLPTDANSFSSIAPLPAEIGAMLESLNRNMASGKKRPAHRPESDDEEEDEEQQFRRLEENTKRVKLEAEQVAAAAVTAIADIASRAAKADKADKSATRDVEMDEEVSAATDSGPFVLHKSEDITPELREQMMNQAFNRVVDASKKVKALVESMHVQGSRDVAEINAPRVLPNGLSTNAGVLEDAMLLLVRLISNFYITQADTDRLAASKQADSVLSHGIRECIGG